MVPEKYQCEYVKPFKLTIVTFNVNGLIPCLKRLGYKRHEDLKDFLTRLIPDASIICLQEIKLRLEGLSQPLCRPENFEAYYCLATGTRQSENSVHQHTIHRQGYSGVATFCRNGTTLPCDAREGISWVLNRLIHTYSTDTGLLDSPSSSNVFLKKKNLVRSILKKTPIFTRNNKERKMIFQLIDAQDLVSGLSVLRPWADRLDKEGRFLFTHHTSFVLINIYSPALRPLKLGNIPVETAMYDSVRLSMKSAFHCLLHLAVLEVQHSSGNHCLPSLTFGTIIDHAPSFTPVMVVGDFNVQLNVEDGTESLTEYLSKKNQLPFINQTKLMLESCELADAFCAVNSRRNSVYSCWSQIKGARYTNQGSRIDLVLVPQSFVAQNNKQPGSLALSSCRYHVDLRGSDHCPVSATLLYNKTQLSVRTLQERVPPPLCAKWSPRALLYQPTMFEILKKSFVPQCYRCCYLISPKKNLSIHSSVEDNPKLLFLQIAESESHDPESKSLSSVVYMFFKKQTVILSRTSMNATELLCNAEYKKAGYEGCCPAFCLVDSTVSRYLYNFFPATISAILAKDDEEDQIFTNNSSLPVKNICLKENLRALWRLFTFTQTAWGVAFHLKASHINLLYQNPRIALLDNAIVSSLFSLKGTLPLVFVWNHGNSKEEVHTPIPCSRMNELTIKPTITFLGKEQSELYIETRHFAPLCEKHKLPCIKRTVTKRGEKQGKQFWSCVLPKSTKNNPCGRCKTFSWIP